MPEVRTSSKPISGWACRSRLMAVSSSAKASMRSIVGIGLSDGGGVSFWRKRRYECRAVWFEPNARAQSGPGQGGGVGRHGAGRSADQEFFGDRLKVGAEVHGTLVHKDRLFGRFDPDIAKHRLIRQLGFVRTHDDTNAVDVQASRRAHIHVAATEV